MMIKERFCEKNEEKLVEIISNSYQLKRLFEILKESNIPFNYYIGAGCITNTIWNHLSGYPLTYGISDVDVVYFDNKDLSLTSEQKFTDYLVDKIGDFPFRLDVKNQARVHLWYEKKFGFSIQPYVSLEDAIHSWPTTATSLGIRKEQSDLFNIYAPFNLDDLFSMIVRPNKRMITREIYENKAIKWHKKWPELTVIPW